MVRDFSTVARRLTRQYIHKRAREVHAQLIGSRRTRLRPTDSLAMSAALIPSPMNPPTCILPREDADGLLLVGRREAREERRLLCRVGQLGIGHFLHIAAEEHGHEADVPAFAGNQLVDCNKIATYRTAPPNSKPYGTRCMLRFWAVAVIW